MFNYALVLAVFFALGLQAVQSKFNSISFPSVTQCGSFTVSFSGGKLPSALPLTLTVVPFNSTPIAIVIPTFQWNATTATGAVVTFLPLPAGAEFVASLDDAFGQPTGLTSDVIAVYPSTNTTCLSSATNTPRYTLPDTSTLSQCAPFDISYVPGIVDVSPTIRAFVPKNESFPVNFTSVPTAGTATYTMDVPQGLRAVLMLSDDTGFRQSTDLFVVGGSTTSSTDCLPVFTAGAAPAPDNAVNAPAASSGGLSRPAVIAIAVVTTVIVTCIALAMALWASRYRRKLREAAEKLKWFYPEDKELWGSPEKTKDDFPPFSLAEKQQIPEPQTPPSAVLFTRHSDTTSSQVGGEASYFKRPSASSGSLRSLSLLQPGFSRFNPAPILPSLPTSPFAPHLKQPVSRTPSQHTFALSTQSRQRTSVSSADIEYMLEVGTISSIPGTIVSSRSHVHTNTATSDSSNVESKAFTHRSAKSQQGYERPLLPVPTPSPKFTPSYVRTSDGAVVTSTYDDSNWVARSQPSSPDTSGSRASRPLTLASRSSKRNPPQALIPSSPVSQMSVAPDPPFTFDESRFS